MRMENTSFFSMIHRILDAERTARRHVPKAFPKPITCPSDSRDGLPSPAVFSIMVLIPFHNSPSRLFALSPPFFQKIVNCSPPPPARCPSADPDTSASVGWQHRAPGRSAFLHRHTTSSIPRSRASASNAASRSDRYRRGQPDRPPAAVVRHLVRVEPPHRPDVQPSRSGRSGT
jgi:hypothetical protein